ncbi:hypothetical protein Xen7305DRAFT_00027970 [Xenococcus sp. PCC 7305]|nr:hypothetical protein Xen7305DRAFT_00027970 [Xenococcus sp. PCC 7305]
MLHLVVFIEDQYWFEIKKAILLQLGFDGIFEDS